MADFWNIFLSTAACRKIAHSGRLLNSDLLPLLLSSLGFPSHEIAAEWEERCVDGSPGKKYTEIETDFWMQVKDNAASGFNN